LWNSTARVVSCTYPKCPQSVSKTWKTLSRKVMRLGLNWLKLIRKPENIACLPKPSWRAVNPPALVREEIAVVAVAATVVIVVVAHEMVAHGAVAVADTAETATNKKERRHASAAGALSFGQAWI
jgi:hypothetical protein